MARTARSLSKRVGVPRPRLLRLGLGCIHERKTKDRSSWNHFTLDLPFVKPQPRYVDLDCGEEHRPWAADLPFCHLSRASKTPTEAVFAAWQCRKVESHIHQLHCMQSV